MLEFLKKYGILLLLGVFLLASVIYNIVQKYEIADKNAKIYSQDSLIKLDSTKYKQVTEELQNEQQAKAYLIQINKDLAAQIEKAKEDIKEITQLVLKVKSQTFTYIDTNHVLISVNDTVKVKVGEDSVDINANYGDVAQIKGKTWLYPYKGYKLDVEGKPINVDIVLTEDENGVYNTYVDTHNANLELLKINPKVLANNNKPGFFDNIHLLTGLDVTTQNIGINLGLSFSKLGIKGIVGHTFNSNITQPLYYGAGVYYYLF